MEMEAVYRVECPRFGRYLEITELTVFCVWYVHEEIINIVCPNISSANRPLPRGEGLPVPEPPDIFAMHSNDEDSVSSNSEEEQASASRDADFLPSRDSS